MKGKIADGEARERLIIRIRRRMQEFGITFDALEALIQEDLAHPPLYRDARGHDWNGVGPMPDWLTAAKHAGVDPDFFRIEEKAKEEPQGKRDVVYRPPFLKRCVTRCMLKRKSLNRRASILTCSSNSLVRVFGKQWTFPLPRST